MPENEMPDAYGVDDLHFPAGFGAQMLYPFQHIIDEWRAKRRPVAKSSKSI
jgi:hypothetical protein